jgi:ATP-dependent DNA helicase RecG
MNDADLIELMPRACDAFLESSPQNSQALVERWFGHKVDFGHV